MDPIQRLYNLDPVAGKIRSVWRHADIWLPSLDFPHELLGHWGVINSIPIINSVERMPNTFSTIGFPSQNYQIYTFDRGVNTPPIAFRSFPYLDRPRVEAVDGSQIYMYVDWVMHFAQGSSEPTTGIFGDLLVEF